MDTPFQKEISISKRGSESKKHMVGIPGGVILNAFLST